MHPIVANLTDLLVGVPAQHHELVRRAHLHHICLAGTVSVQADCLRNAISVVLAAADLGVPCLFQAGSMQWRRVRHEDDDGVSATHFAYEWDPSRPINRALIGEAIRVIKAAKNGEPLPALRMLCEVHCWAVRPDSEDVVDLSTGGLPRAAMAMAGLDWSAPHPPKVFIGQPDGDTSQYRAHLEATRLLFALATVLLDERSPTLANRFTTHVLSSAKFAQSLHPAA